MARPLVDRIVDELINSTHNPMELHKKHGISRAKLAKIIKDKAEEIDTACWIADRQTQAMLSGYRYLAANRLHLLARGKVDEEPVPVDVTRKACVDLLRLNMPGAPGTPGIPRTPGSVRDEPMTQDEIDAELERIYGRKPERDASPSQ
jgi:hypothetical protein